MQQYSLEFQVLWADIDANRHMRHSAYNDYAAQVRLGFFSEFGFAIEQLEKERVGPILFREETVFLKEVGMNEKITVDISLAAMRKDGSKWRIVHNIYKRGGVLSCIITVDGAWLDLEKRKLRVPPEGIINMVASMPKAPNFEYLPDKAKD